MRDRARWWFCWHGFPLEPGNVGRAIAGSGAIYRVIAPDLRGHGESPAPDGVYTMDEMADDVVETLASLHISEPMVLGGLSIGGYVALSLVLRYPEKVRRCMLMDTQAGADIRRSGRDAGSHGAGGSRSQQRRPDRRNNVGPAVQPLSSGRNGRSELSRSGTVMTQTSPRRNRRDAARDGEKAGPAR